MRVIGEVNTDDEGLLLGAYLLQNGIESRVEKERSGKCSIWIVDEDKITSAFELMKKFDSEVDKSVFKEALYHAKVVEQAKKSEQEKYERNQINARARWNMQGGRKVVTSFLIGICVAIWVFEIFSPEMIPYVQSALMISNPYQSGLGFGSQILHGQIWRLFTPALMHAPLLPNGNFDFMGIIHILFNMQWLSALGGIIENRHGSKYMFVLFLVFAALPNLFQYYMSGPMFLGMSGVNYALLTFLWIRGRFDSSYGIKLNPGIVWLMMIWFIIGFTTMHTANWVHAGGVICGGVWGYISSRHWKQD